MKTGAIFGETDLGLTVGDMTITVETLAGSPVDTTGWTMVEMASPPGSYEINVPLCFESSTIYLEKTIDPNVFYHGVMSFESWQIIAPIYAPGVIMMPAATAPGDVMIFHANTDYDLISFMLPTYWTTHLLDPEIEFWFTLVAPNRQTRPVLDAKGEVYNALTRECRLALTATQTALKPGDYSWQAQLRKTVAGVVEKHNALEGKAYVKSTFKV
jgi:hypothetical protein